MATHEQWLAKLAKLRVHKTGGDPAPHKPLLILVVLELAEQNLLQRDILPLTPELAFRFCTYANIVAERRSQRLDIRYPFFHLKSDGIWSPLDDAAQPSDSHAKTRYAALPADFVAFAYDPVARDKARRILIAKFFQPYERLNLYELIGMPVPTEDEESRSAKYSGPEEAVNQGREARFRLNVVAAYNYTCALTGYRLTTITGSTIVDAAHIHQFSNSKNNDPRNGLALTKNAHWSFDNGLWTLSDDFEVIVARGRFAESGPDQQLLARHNGQRIQLPCNTQLWPSLLHIAWHREKVFLGT